MYAEGPIRYEGAAGPGNLDAVYTGHHLSGGGALVLRESANVELLANEQFVRLNEPGRYPITELFRKAPVRRGILGLFYDFISRGLEDSGSTEDLERAYQANQGNAQGNISGLGDGGLAGLRPFGGTIGPDPLRFTWPGESAATGYRLRIVDSLSEAVVLEATVRDTSLHLDAGDLHFRDGGTYYWEVFPNLPARSGPTRLGVASPTVAGTRIYFTYRDESSQSVIQNLGELPTSIGADDERSRTLMTAMVLEDAGYLFAADGVYRDALARSASDPLLRRTYAAFLSRWNQRSAARSLLNEAY
jgi:hypothetical protein